MTSCLSYRMDAVKHPYESLQREGCQADWPENIALAIDGLIAI